MLNNFISRGKGSSKQEEKKKSLPVYMFDKNFLFLSNFESEISLDVRQL